MNFNEKLYLIKLRIQLRTTTNNIITNTEYNYEYKISAFLKIYLFEFI